MYQLVSRRGELSVPISFATMVFGRSSAESHELVGVHRFLFCVDYDDTVDVALLVLLFHLHVEYFACMAYALMHDAAGL